MELVINHNGELDFEKQPVPRKVISTETQLVDEGAELIGECVRGKISVKDFHLRMLSIRKQFSNNSITA